MLKIDEWAKDRPKEIAMFAQQLALLIKLIFQLLTRIKNNALKFEGVIELPKAEEWLWFYRNHRHIERWLIPRLKEAGNFPAIIGNSIEQLFGNSSTDCDNEINQFPIDAYSRASRPLIPFQVVHPFQSNPSTDSI